MSYPKVLAMHHLPLFIEGNWSDYYYIAQEKVDGSQFKCHVKDVVLWTSKN